MNSDASLGYFLVGTFFFALLTSYPIEFWRKTPYLFGNTLAFYLFFNVCLCPDQQNSFKALSLHEEDLNLLPQRAFLAYSFIVFSLCQTYVVNSLLGRRTGHCLTLLLRLCFFLVICFQTLLILVLIRLSMHVEL